MRIDHIEARVIRDTRGRPTVEATVSANALSATASVPSGKSTGSHEACELRDADGGVAQAVANVNGEIARSLIGRRLSPDELDSALIELDGTQNKSRLGANALLAVSIATERLSALLRDVPLWRSIADRAGTVPTAPRLFVNVMNGGVHALPTQTDHFKLPFQEYLLVVEGDASETFPRAQEIFTKLGEQLGAGTPFGDEGGYAPTFDTIEQPFHLLAEVVEKTSKASIAFDAAASELCRPDGTYELLGRTYSADALSRLYQDLAGSFQLHSIEDPFDEESVADFSLLLTKLDGHTLVVGDDLTVTNSSRIRAVAEQKAINAVLIKPNQIGTVKEALASALETVALGWQVIASHRSGETHDTFIADFAYGIGAHGIKAGGLGQKERLEKYERLLAIENEAKTV